MKIFTDTWHARNWHFWLNHTSSSKADQFFNSTHSSYNFEKNDWDVVIREGRQPDLCTYTRVVFLWSPALRFNSFRERQDTFVQVILDAFGITLLFGAIFHLIAFIDSGIDVSWWYPYAIGIVGILGISALVGVVYFTIWLVLDVLPKVISYLRRKNESEEYHSSLIVKRVKAHKQKVCPIIEFEEKETNANG